MLLLFSSSKVLFAYSSCVLIFGVTHFCCSGTENAIGQLRKFGFGHLLDILKPALPEDAALAIIKGGATRARQIFFPYWEALLVTLFRDWFPEALDTVSLKLYEKPT